MTDQNKGLVASGAALVMRHQRVLWWVFAVNLVLGAIGAHEAAHTLDHFLGHSLAGRPLVDRFDLGMFFELVDRPQVNLLGSHGMSLICALLFFIFMLFVAGGILSVYSEDRRFATGDFFAASGAFFWRFVRLMLLSLIPFAILGFLYSAVQKLADFVDERATADQASFSITLVGLLILALVALCVRLWFDIAQVRAVMQNERGMWRNTWKALGITRRNLGTLFRAYFCIAFFAWAALAIGIWIWAYLPAKTIPLTFLLLELIMLAQIASRLWQRASAVTWYRRHALEVPADSVDYTTPHPVELAEPPVELPPSEEPPAPPPTDEPGPNPNPGLPPLDV